MAHDRDRRKHVRVRPTIELPAQIALAAAEVGTKLQLVDISLGGIGMWVQRGAARTAGETLTLAMDLAGKTIDVNAIVRHSTPDGMLHGLEFVDVSPEAQDVINKYVSELAERGAMA